MITLSKKTISIIDSIILPIREKYIKHKLQEQEPNWIKQYNVIRGDAWPDCNSYSNFDLLPEHIKKECIEVHKYSPTILKNAINDDANHSINIENFFQLNSVLGLFLEKNLNVIKNKKIIDLACNVGHLSIFACENNCSEVLGVDFRIENLQIAKAIQNDYNISKKLLNYIQCNLHDTDQIANLCRDKDTVFLCGIMYHVRNHHDILKAACQHTVKDVVIETGENSTIENAVAPLIWWKYETTLTLVDGADEFHTGKTLVGYPNRAWFDLVLNELGFICESTTKYSKSSSQNSTEEFKQNRTIYLYSRK